MEILGIGPLEVLFILVIALLILGPSDMAKAGRSAGEFIGRFMHSPTWHALQRMWSEIRNLPNTLAEQAGSNEIREIRDTLKDSTTFQDAKKESDKSGLDAWTRAPDLSDGQNAVTDNSSESTPPEHEQS
jgi:hypothetical protein